jgi:hypothetical protein
MLFRVREASWGGIETDGNLLKPAGLPGISALKSGDPRLRGGNQARPTVIDSRSILAGVQGFESLPPHKIWSQHSDFLMYCLVAYIE